MTAMLLPCELKNGCLNRRHVSLAKNPSTAFVQNAKAAVEMEVPMGMALQPFVYFGRLLVRKHIAQDAMNLVPEVDGRRDPIKKHAVCVACRTQKTVDALGEKAVPPAPITGFQHPGRPHGLHQSASVSEFGNARFCSGPWARVLMSPFGLRNAPKADSGVRSLD